jgi:ABC-type molybdate transport system substrate-binding protein
MKSIRTTFVLAVLAGLVLVTPFPTARAGNAVFLQQAAKPCGTIIVAAASDLTYAMNEIAAIPDAAI